MNVNRKKEVKVALLADYDSTYKQSEILHQKLLEQSNKIQNYTYVWSQTDPELSQRPDKRTKGTSILCPCLGMDSSRPV